MSTLVEFQSGSILSACRRGVNKKSRLGPAVQDPKARDIRSFVAEIDERQRIVTYTRHGEIAPGFVDRGKVVDIRQWRDEATTLAALQLAQQKWGQIQVRGSDEYKRLCARLAAQHSFRIINPELQQEIAGWREQIAKERSSTKQSRVMKPGHRADERQQTPVRDIDEAYIRHREDITKSYTGTGPLNHSQLDWMIAVRLRATGYSADDIENTLRACARGRRNDHRDWDNYAKKTTNQVFGERGGQEIERLSPRE